MHTQLFRAIAVAGLFACTGCDQVPEASHEAAPLLAPSDLKAASSPREFRTLDRAMPSVAYCDPVRDWDPARIDFEARVLQAVNQARAQGADCGREGVFAPAQPLRLNSAMNCPARAHSLDMRDRDFFSHLNPDAEGLGDRVDKTGYDWSALGENIAAGYATPENVVQGWLESPGHCANIMSPDYSQIGIGYVEGGTDRHYWTQVFARGEDLPPVIDLPPQNPAPSVAPLGLWLLALGLLGGAFAPCARQRRSWIGA